MIRPEDFEAVVEWAVKIARNYNERLQPAIVESLIQLAGSASLAGMQRPTAEEDISSKDPAEKLAQVLGCTADDVRSLFQFTDSGFVLYGYKPAATKTDSVRELCALYIAANETVNGRARSTADELVGLLKKYGVYDPGNFSGHHMGKSNWFIASKVDGQRCYELTFQGRQALRDVIRRLTASRSEPG